jgi:hypothetical protein
MTRQIHVSNGTRVQTLATRCSAGGLTILSTFAGDPALTEIHVPVAALAWIAEEARNLCDQHGRAVATALATNAARAVRLAPIVPPLHQIRAEANPGHDGRPGSAAA